MFIACSEAFDVCCWLLLCCIGCEFLFVGRCLLIVVSCYLSLVSCWLMLASWPFVDSCLCGLMVVVCC